MALLQKGKIQLAFDPGIRIRQALAEDSSPKPP
jgi:hypothetical protein